MASVTVKPVVQVLEDLYLRDGELTAESVLAEAESPDSPLHDRFEWDDTIAANEFRLEQARALVRSFEITIEDRPVRRYVFQRSAGTYRPIKEAMSKKNWRDEIVADFERDALAFERRWANHKYVADNYRAWKNKPIP